MFTWKLYSSIGLLALIGGATVSATETSLSKPLSEVRNSTTITAKKMTVRNQENKAIFEGAVVRAILWLSRWLNASGAGPGMAWAASVVGAQPSVTTSSAPSSPTRSCAIPYCASAGICSVGSVRSVFSSMPC